MPKRAEVVPGAVFSKWLVLEAPPKPVWKVAKYGPQKGKRVLVCDDIDCRCLGCGAVVERPWRSLRKWGLAPCAECQAEDRASGWPISDSPVEVAWAAGLFEGEGSIMLAQSKGRWTPRLSLAMTDDDVVRRFKDIVGRGTVSGPTQRANPKHKPIYTWRASGWLSCDEILTAFLPHLGKRRAKRARVVLGWDRNPYRHQDPPEWILERMEAEDAAFEAELRVRINAMLAEQGRPLLPEAD